MSRIELLRANAEYAFNEFRQALDGVTQKQAWGVLPAACEEYLHTDGSIQGVVLHVAGGKRMYGSVGFRDSEVRWRDVAAEMDAFEPDWEAALRYLDESHAYWMASWACLAEADLDVVRPIPIGRTMETWKILQIQSHHDAYHAGQIAVLRYAVRASDERPPSVAEDIRQYCRELPSW